MSLTSRKASSLHKQLKSDGGFSASLSGGASPSEGFMVSLPGTEQQVANDQLSPAHISNYAAAHSADLSRTDHFLGGWQGARETSLDVSQNVRPRADVSLTHGRSVAVSDALTSAMDLAVARNQEAVYDLQTGDSRSNPAFDPSRRR